MDTEFFQELKKRGKVCIFVANKHDQLWQDEVAIDELERYKLDNIVSQRNSATNKRACEDKMSEENKDYEKGVFDSEYYFKLGDAVDDVSMAFGTKEKALAGAKLVGKTIFNSALFSGKIGLKILKKLPDEIARQAENKK